MSNSGLFITANPPDNSPERDRIAPGAKIVELGAIPDWRGQPAAGHWMKTIPYIIEHVRKHGTMDNLALFGDGSAQGEGGGMADTNIFDWLDALKQAAEAAGIKQVSKRIIFNGCDTFAFADQRWARTTIAEHKLKALSQSASELNAELVGTTTMLGFLNLRKNAQGQPLWENAMANYIAVTPDGTVKRDKLDRPWSQERIKYDLERHPEDSLADLIEPPWVPNVIQQSSRRR